MYDITSERVWLAGHRGLVGSAIQGRLTSEPVADLVTIPLRDGIAATYSWFVDHVDSARGT